MKKKHSRKWSASQRRNHAATIAARRAAKELPPGQRRNGTAWTRPDDAPAAAPSPAPASNGNGTTHFERDDGVAALLDSIKLIRATGEGLVALASMLERMDREHVAQFVKGFGFRLDLPTGGQAIMRGPNERRANPAM